MPETPEPRPRRSARPRRRAGRRQTTGPDLRSRQGASVGGPRRRTGSRHGDVRTSRARRVKTDSRSRHKTLIAVVVLVALVLAVGIPVYGAWQLLIKPETDVEAGRPVQLDIPEGAGTQRIAEILAEAGVIDNAAMFRLRARLDGIDGKLRPGIYDLSTGMEYDAVVDRLLAGPPIEYVTLTIPEGFTVEQIAERVAEVTGIPAEEFLALATDGIAAFAVEHPYVAEIETGTLEGYLFPKTYRIVEGSTATDVIEIMLDQFDTEIATVDLSRATEAGLTLHEVVTLASMVEREARVADERPLVASVIYNRLDRGMLLEIDATIEYVIKERKPRLLNRDLEIDSPYNTYKYPGLPPGPIASPGLASLEAAANPADTEYLYYVLTSEDGSHTFTETYQEFLEAKERSRDVVP